MDETVKIVMPKASYRPEFSDEDREAIRALANGVADAFGWGSTPEGPAFWASVHKRLEQMAERGY